MNENQLSGLVVATAVSACVGAFFSYLFVRMADMLKMLYDRQVAGFNALVAIHRWLHETYNINSTNLYVVDDKLNDTGSPAIHVGFSDLYEIDFDSNRLEKLLNLDFINELGKFGSDVQKLNHTVVSMNSMHNEFRSALLNKSIDTDTYRANSKVYLDGLRELRGFLVDSASEIVRLTALTRVLSRNKPMFSRIVQWISRPATPSKEAVDKELAILRKEMADNTRANGERISKIITGKPKAS